MWVTSVEPGQLGLGAGLVEQVNGDEGGLGLEVRRSPRQPDDIPPAFGLECLGDAAPDHTETADDDCLSLRHFLISSSFYGPRPVGAHDRQAARTGKPPVRPKGLTPPNRKEHMSNTCGSR